MKITKKLTLMLKSMLSIKLGSVVTDKQELFWDAEEDLAAGMEVFVKDEEGEFQPAPDGDYATEDGKTIKVVEGRVAEIVDPKAEVEEETQETPENVEQENVEQEENPDVDPADEAEDQEEEVSVEDRIAAIEERIQAFMDGINQIVNSMAALEERLAVVEEKLAKVEEPAADPVDEEPEVQQSKSILSYLKKK